MPTERDREIAREWLWRSSILGWDECDQESLAALVERSGREGEARALAKAEKAEHLAAWYGKLCDAAQNEVRLVRGKRASPSDAKPVAWLTRATTSEITGVYLHEPTARDASMFVSALYERAAPSPSARAEEPAFWANVTLPDLVTGWCGALYNTEANAKAQEEDDDSEPTVALYRAPPDLTAEISKLREEADRRLADMHDAHKAEIAKLKERERALSVDGSEYQQEAETLREEIAKLKVQLDLKSTSYDGAQSAVAWWVEEGKRMAAEIAKLKAERDEKDAARQRLAESLELFRQDIASLRALLDGTRREKECSGRVIKSGGLYLREDGMWDARRSEAAMLPIGARIVRLTRAAKP